MDGRVSRSTELVFISFYLPMLPMTVLLFILLNRNNYLPSHCLFQVGRFFGEVDGSVMASLIKMGMFKKYWTNLPLILKQYQFPP